MIHNINQLKLGEDDKQKLLQDARLLKQTINVRFTILRVTKTTVVIGVKQGYHMAENYGDADTLAEVARMQFKKYVGDRQVITEPVTYSPQPDEMPTIPVPYNNGLLRKAKTIHKDFDQDELEDYQG